MQELKLRRVITKVRDIESGVDMDVLAAKAGDTTLIFQRAAMFRNGEIAIDGAVLAIKFKNSDVETKYVHLRPGVYRLAQRVEVLPNVAATTARGLD